jgi:hypothetical protein
MLKEQCMDTSTTYLGLKLAHPFMAGASTMGYRLDTITRLEDAGCAAILLHSLFEEQIAPPAAELDAATPDPRFPNTAATFPGPSDYLIRPTPMPSTCMRRSGPSRYR